MEDRSKSVEDKSKSVVDLDRMDEMIERMENREPRAERALTVREYVFRNFPKLLKLVEKGYSVGDIYRQIVEDFGVSLSEVTFSSYYYQAKAKWEKENKGRRGVNLRKRPSKKAEPKAVESKIEPEIVEPKPIESKPEPAKADEVKSGSEHLADFKSDTERRDSEFEKLAAQIKKNTGE